MSGIKKIFSPVTTRQCGEFGLVAILVTAFLGFYSRQYVYSVVVFVLSLVTLVVPIVFYPLAIFWFGLSKILNAVSSRIVLTVIFFVIVTPMGLIRRMAGKDDMKIKSFKKSRKSAMTKREHQYLPDDFLHTF